MINKCFKTFNLEGTQIPLADFVLAWQKSSTTKEVCERLAVKVPTNKTCKRLANKANALRRKGLKLKPYARQSNSQVTTEDIDILNRLLEDLAV
jgi:hypothetical protein